MILGAVKHNQFQKKNQFHIINSLCNWLLIFFLLSRWYSKYQDTMTLLILSPKTLNFYGEWKEQTRMRFSKPITYHID